MVAGGKYTTYRVMARDAVDAAVEGLGRPVPPSCTERVPVVGADGFEAAWNRRDATARELGLEVAQVEHLLRRYGTLLTEIATALRDHPELAEPVEGAPSYLRVEAWYAAAAEGALHLDDILTRRTRISILTGDRGVTAAQDVARVVAPVLGWDADDVEREVLHYRARVQAERESQAQPDDLTADAARLGAADVRGGARRSVDKGSARKAPVARAS
jgi:glycerol-3-phosphate dehydrogenase